MTSLFLRMPLVHWVGIVLLILNALLLTDNISLINHTTNELLRELSKI